MLDFREMMWGCIIAILNMAMRCIWKFFSDSDWGSNKQHRKSVSGCYICCGTALLYSSSRTQRVVALSSAEAEVYSASSSACDGILIGKLVAFCTGRNVVIHHLMDSARSSWNTGTTRRGSY